MGQPTEPAATTQPAAPAPAQPSNKSARPPHGGGSSSGGSGYNPGSGGSSGGSGYNPGGGSSSSGGSGYNPGGGSSSSGGSGYNPGSSGSRPSYGSGSSGGSNPGHGGGYNPGGGSGYNPGSNWNGHEGLGWNPGNYYQPSVIRGWVRLGSARAGKSADKDIINAYGSYRYSSIKLCVRSADVSFYDAQVVFTRGAQQDLRLRYKVKRGQCTPTLNLRGGRRSDIRYVYLYFRQADNILNWRTADVDLFAR
jgi:hypothetical protein